MHNMYTLVQLNFNITREGLKVTDWRCHAGTVQNGSKQSVHGRCGTVQNGSVAEFAAERFRTVPALIVRCLGWLQIHAGTVLNGSVLIVGTVQNCSAATLRGKHQVEGGKRLKPLAASSTESAWPTFVTSSLNLGFSECSDLLPSQGKECRQCSSCFGLWSLWSTLVFQCRLLPCPTRTCKYGCDVLTCVFLRKHGL